MMNVFFVGAVQILVQKKTICVTLTFVITSLLEDNRRAWPIHDIVVNHKIILDLIRETNLRLAMYQGLYTYGSSTKDLSIWSFQRPGVT